MLQATVWLNPVLTFAQSLAVSIYTNSPSYSSLATSYMLVNEHDVWCAWHGSQRAQMSDSQTTQPITMGRPTPTSNTRHATLHDAPTGEREQEYQSKEEEAKTMIRSKNHWLFRKNARRAYQLTSGSGFAGDEARLHTPAASTWLMNSSAACQLLQSHSQSHQATNYTSHLQAPRSQHLRHANSPGLGRCTASASTVVIPKPPASNYTSTPCKGRGPNPCHTHRKSPNQRASPLGCLPNISE